MYTQRQRFLDTINFKKPQDRLPKVEWAAWWDVTMNGFIKDGMPTLGFDESLKYFNLDTMYCIAAPTILGDAPQPAHHGAGIMETEEDFRALEKYLLTDQAIDAVVAQAKALKEAHDKGDCIIRLWLDGFFWYPRTLFGIENHLYSFYDYPELYHEMCEKLADFHIKTIDAVTSVLIPDMAGLAEDMSYNNGPMLSYDTYKEFIYPYYQKVIPHLKKHGIKVFVDSDGKLEGMIPWLIEAGVEGIYPLERQAQVDINFIRDNYPNFLMLGGFDKTVMKNGEAAMRAEFERIFPVMKSLGYVPSVDHQTPPDVSLENYKIYARLLDEYTKKAVQG